MNLLSHLATGTSTGLWASGQWPGV